MCDEIRLLRTAEHQRLRRARHIVSWVFVAMKLTGHQTRSIFDRYDITSPGDLREAARRLEQAGQWPDFA